MRDCTLDLCDVFVLQLCDLLVCWSRASSWIRIRREIYLHEDRAKIGHASNVKKNAFLPYLTLEA
jgi:hypothetical protein